MSGLATKMKSTIDSMYERLDFANINPGTSKIELAGDVRSNNGNMIPEETVVTVVGYVDTPSGVKLTIQSPDGEEATLEYKTESQIPHKVVKV